MRYELMLPHQVRTAIDENWPVVLPLGVMEYHGEHMALGMDTLAVVKVLERFERERQIVILPTFTYGSGTYAVAPPERSGGLQVNPDELMPMATGLFRSLLRVGFRNIHFVIHHQTENFAVGMPTDLAFKFAARQAIFAFLAETRGEGWWGDEGMRGLLCRAEGRARSVQLDQGPSADGCDDARALFVRPCGDRRDVADARALPGSRRLEPARGEHEVVQRDRAQATAELGEQGVAMILEHLRKVLV